MAFLRDNHVEILHQDTNVDDVILKKIKEHKNQVKTQYFYNFLNPL